VSGLRSHLREVEASGILRVDGAARRVAALFHDPPREAEWRPILRAVSRLAFGTLPAVERELYGVELSAGRRAAMRAAFAAMRLGRPFLPARYRFIAPYQERLLRSRGSARADAIARARRAAGIRLDRAKSLRDPT
jgi:hypothetical protein